MHYHQRELAYQTQRRINVIAYKQALENKRGSCVKSRQHSHSLYLTHLCGNRVDGAEKTNKQGSWVFFAFSTLVCHHANSLPCGPREQNGFVGNEHFQIEISIISCLITSQIAIFKDKSVPSCFVSFRLDCFILCLNQKSHFLGYFSKSCFSKMSYYLH